MDSEKKENVKEYTVEANFAVKPKGFQILDQESTELAVQDSDSIYEDNDFSGMGDEFADLGLVMNSNLDNSCNRTMKETDYESDAVSDTSVTELCPTSTVNDELIPQRKFLTQCLSELESCIINKKTYSSSERTSSSFESESFSVEQETTETETETKTSEYDHFVFDATLQQNKEYSNLCRTHVQNFGGLEDELVHCSSDSSEIVRGSDEKSEGKSIFLTECSSSEEDTSSQIKKRIRNRTIDYHDLKSLMWEGTVCNISIKISTSFTCIIWLE